MWFEPTSILTALRALLVLYVLSPYIQRQAYAVLGARKHTTESHPLPLFSWSYDYAAGLNSSNRSVTVLSSFGALAPCSRQRTVSG